MRYVWVDQMRLTGKTTQEIVCAFRELHSNQYTYEDLPDRIVSDTHLKIRCSQHGIFIQRADHHGNGSACPRCRGSFYKTTEDCLRELEIAHGDRFDYSLVKYVNSKTPITLICKKHGAFKISPGNAIKPASVCCVKCINRNIHTTDDFIAAATQKHPQFDYSQVIYVNAKTKVIVRCPCHGTFELTPDIFMHTTMPCVNCRTHARAEKEWLRSLGIPHLQYQHRIQVGGKRYRVDGFDPQTNTVYEFDGDYFHGNPKYFDYLWMNRVSRQCFGDLHKKTIAKRADLKSAGYNVIWIWESDYYASVGKKYTAKAQDYTSKIVARLNYFRSMILADDEVTNFDIFAGLYTPDAP